MRGCEAEDIERTVRDGTQSPARAGRVRFTLHIQAKHFNPANDKWYNARQVDVIALEETDRVIAITVIVKHYNEVLP